MTSSQRKTYPDVGYHFSRMAGQYDEGSENVKWRGPHVLFQGLQLLYGAEEPPPLEKPIKILDLGTGTGMIGALFKEHFDSVHITGVDIALEMLEKAKRSARIDEIIHGSVTDLSWSGNAQYDVVTSSGVMDFIDDSEAFVAEATRVAKPGGLIAVTFEPEGTDFPGYMTLQHDAGRIKSLFRRHGAPEIELESNVKDAYVNFSDPDRKPVENHLLIVSKTIDFNI